MNNQINQKPIRAEQPDKAMFYAMMGAFFIFFSLPAFYWAIYNYGEYSRTTEFVQELREKPAANLTPNEKKEIESRISINSSMVDRYRLEMFLSGAGGLVLFGIALMFFRAAFRARKRKNYYEEIDWRTTLMPTARLEVRFAYFQNILLIGLIAFFGLLIAFNLYQTLTSPFSSGNEIIVKGGLSLFVVALCLFLVFLMIRAKRRAVCIFDASGITRGDGRHFYWAEFCGVVTQTARNRFGKSYVWRTELAFSGGETAWIIPPRIKNAPEVFAYIAQFPPAKLKTVA